MFLEICDALHIVQRAKRCTSYWDFRLYVFCGTTNVADIDNFGCLQLFADSSPRNVVNFVRSLF